MRIPLPSCDDPRLADYCDLKSSNLTRHSGKFIAEGRFVVERLLASERLTHSVVVSETVESKIASQVPNEVPMFVLPKDEVNRLIGFQFHQGVLACGQRPENPSLETLLSDASPPAIWAACVRVNDPVNLAALIRSCRAFGVAGLLLDQGCADPYSRRVVRVSMGNVFRMPIFEHADLKSELASIRQQHDLKIFGTALDDRAVPLTQVRPYHQNVLVFGNEGEGLDESWIEFCDELITIPMRGGTDSLNVSVAAGIFLHHFDAHIPRPSE